MKIYLTPNQHQQVVEMGYPVLPTFSDGNRKKIFYIQNTEENRAKILSCLSDSNPYLLLIKMNKDMYREMSLLKEVVSLAKEDNLSCFSINGYQLMTLNASEIFLEFTEPSVMGQWSVLEGVIPEKELDDLEEKLTSASKGISELVSACIKSRLKNDEILKKEDDE